MHLYAVTPLAARLCNVTGYLNSIWITITYRICHSQIAKRLHVYTLYNLVIHALLKYLLLPIKYQAFYTIQIMCSNRNIFQMFVLFMPLSDNICLGTMAIVWYIYISTVTLIRF